MALDYRLQLATAGPAGAVAAELHAAARPLDLFDSSADAALAPPGAVTRQGTVVCVLPHRAAGWGDLTQEAFGFTPTVDVGFRLDKFTGIGAQLDTVVHLTARLLDRLPGDAVLHFTYDTVWLVRRGDALALHESGTVWTPQRLAALTAPWTRATHTYP